MHKNNDEYFPHYIRQLTPSLTPTYQKVINAK